MQPLITIETVPISIEYVEKAPVKSHAPKTAKLEITKENNQVNIKSNPIEIKMDSFQTTQMSEPSYTATAGYDGSGNLSMNVSFTATDNTVARDATRYTQVARGIDNMIDTMPATKSATGLPLSNSTIGPGTLKINFDLSNVSDLSGSEDAYFQPPDLELKVVEYPEVIIRYVGGPLYFPRSADPNYTPAATTQNLDMKI